MKTLISILIVLFIANANAFAQDSTLKLQEKKYPFAIGGGAGFATGYGLSFRYNPNKFGAQLNFAPYKSY